MNHDLIDYMKEQVSAALDGGGIFVATHDFLDGALGGAGAFMLADDWARTTFGFRVHVSGADADSTCFRRSTEEEHAEAFEREVQQRSATRRAYAELGLSVPPRVNRYERPQPAPVSQGMQSLAMYGLDLSELDGGDEPETRLQTTENYLKQWAEVAKALDQLQQDGTVTVGVDQGFCYSLAAPLAVERDIGARDSDLPGIRARTPSLPAPVPAPQPKASTARPALAGLTTMRPIDHRPGLWQAPEGAA